MSKLSGKLGKIANQTFIVSQKLRILHAILMLTVLETN